MLIIYIFCQRTHYKKTHTHTNNDYKVTETHVLLLRYPFFFLFLKSDLLFFLILRIKRPLFLLFSFFFSSFFFHNEKQNAHIYTYTLYIRHNDDENLFFLSPPRPIFYFCLFNPFFSLSFFLPFYLVSFFSFFFLPPCCHPAYIIIYWRRPTSFLTHTQPSFFLFLLQKHCTQCLYPFILSLFHPFVSFFLYNI